MGRKKNFILQISKAFILPSISEGIPIAVLEALSHKSLCLLTKECNFEKLEKIGIHQSKLKKIPRNLKLSLKKLFELNSNEFNKRIKIGLKYIKMNIVGKK